MREAARTVEDAGWTPWSAAATAERFGGIDILVANAGVGAYGPFLDLPPDQLDEMIDVNVKGTLYAVRATLPYLLKSDAADIVTIASEAGRRGLPYEVAYCASKFALEAFSDALRAEVKPAGIRVALVEPGPVATNFVGGSKGAGVPEPRTMKL